MFTIGQDKSGRIHARFKFPKSGWRQQTSGCKDPDEADDVFVTMQYFMNQSNKPKNNSKQALLDFMRKVYQEKFDEECPMMLTMDYLNRLVGTNQHFVAGSTQEVLIKTVEWFGKFLEQAGLKGSLLDNNSPPVIRRFGSYLVTVGKHNVSSANMRLEVLETAFGHAVKEQFLAKNPVKGIRLKDRHAESEEDVEVHQPYTKAHIYTAIDRGIMAGCNPEMAVMQLLSCDIAARGGDMFALSREMFHGNAEVRKSFLKYYARKPKKWHKVYPLEESIPLIQEYLDHHLLDRSADALFFPTFGHRTGPQIPDGDFNKGSSNALNYFGFYLEALKLRVKLDTELGGKSSYSHASHSGRVTSITMAAQEGIPESVTCARVIHHGREVHRIYQKHSPEAVQRAMSGDHNEDGVVNITMAEFRTALIYATERLRSLRGQLDLHDGSPPNKSQRANLTPVVTSSEKLAA